MKLILRRSIAFTVFLTLMVLLVAADIPSRSEARGPDYWVWAAPGFTTTRSTYLIGQPVIFTYRNDTGEVVELPGGAPWMIEDGDGNAVFTPISTMILIFMESGQATGWTWDQKDNDGAQVDAGDYTIVLRTSAGAQRATFTISGGTNVATPPISDPDARPFADVTGLVDGDAYIVALHERGVVKGKSDGAFAPEDAVTRAEFVAMLLRAFGVEPGVATDLVGDDWGLIFTDVAHDHWSFGYIAWAAQMGYVDPAVEEPADTRDPDSPVSPDSVSAGDRVFGVFRPDDLITGSDVVAIVEKAAGASSSEAVSAFASANSITRRDACVLVYQLLAD